ncbi:heterokaryon incompatibility protein [Fusarium circinatum]|uniref:Heterokaryon incompatibility protein n=1 Tax=Fusarium circinatum TaxID=48490 RepID=A0A8H5UAF0_FUSCI|nr:heterokaryon incompatibility protein [Fusarium circinatum]
MNWINNCRTYHPECGKLQKRESWWPTRLIDVGNEGDGKWRIVSLPDKLQPPPTYMTLSYRWGSTGNFRLLKENLCSFQNGLPIAHLPRTFQDALLVAWRFSVKFLWIDALCIIQDCREDWSRESAAMRLVYANALCNLAAVASSDPHGGLFRSRNTEDLQPTVVRAALDRSTPPEDYFAVDSEYTQRQFLDKELLKRGWVFQERLLSPRVLYFADKQVFWECFTEQKCETFPHGIPQLGPSKSQCLSILTDHRNGTLAAEKRPTLLIAKEWESLVEEYTDCKLTEAGDRLHAIEGVADLFREAFHDTYAFGLWKTELARQLSYFVKSPRKELPSRDVAPSWSWASLQSPVKFEHSSWWPETTEHVSVLDLDPIEGALTLRGHILTARIDKKSRYNLVAGNARINAEIYPDRVSEQVNMPDFITLLPLISYWRSRGLGLDCLVLEPTIDTVSGRYRRIAYIKLEQGQDLAFFGMTVLADGSVKIGKVAPSVISLT